MKYWEKPPAVEINVIDVILFVLKQNDFDFSEKPKSNGNWRKSKIYLSPEKK